MLTRRQFFARSAGLASLAAGTSALLALNPDKLPDGSASLGMITSATDEAIRQGLAYLASNQHDSGSFGATGLQGSVAITSLAGLAFMAGGHQPGRNQYGAHVSRALDYVLRQARNVELGTYLSSAGALPRWQGGMQERMYGHGFATLFLSEAYGMVPDQGLRKRLRETLRGAIKLIVQTQNSEGGWRYEPTPKDSDISVTICQIMALRSARNAGIAVPKSTVKNCIEYVKGCQNLARKPDRASQLGDGGFRYANRMIGPSGFARSAAGVVALHSAGVYSGPEVEAGLSYLMRFKPPTRDFNPAGGWADQNFREMQAYYFYGHYYAAQAMWTAGGKYWQKWYPAIRDELLSSNERRRDDHWIDHFSDHYGTAMALIILQIPNNYLPILQK